MNRAARLGAILALGLLVVATVLVGRRGHVGGRPPESAPIDLTVLGPQGAELADLLAKGRLQTFHARYRAASPDQPDQTIELWRNPPNQRQDLVVSASGQVGRTASFLLRNRALTCVQEAPAPWKCQSAPPSASAGVAGGVGPGPDAFLRLLVGEVSGPALDVRDETIAGSSARCFRFPLQAATADVCATRTGVPARISDGSSLIELTSLSAAVPDRVFTPPAPGR